MPPTETDEGLRAADHLRQTRPETGVVVLSQFVESEYALALLEKGAAGRAYLLKERVSDVAQLLDAIKEVARGGWVIDPQGVEALVAAPAKSPSPPASPTPPAAEGLGEGAAGQNTTRPPPPSFL